jgi:molybdopterin synthase catalytic subunit
MSPESAVLPAAPAPARPAALHVGPAPLSVDAAQQAVGGPDMGAVVLFVGTVRDHAKDRRVLRLEYDAYVPMALAEFGRIAAEAGTRWPGVRLAIHHRTGPCAPGETSVVVAAASAHRAEAFEACRHAIERLKHDAPVWKREVYEDGGEWLGQGS